MTEPKPAVHRFGALGTICEVAVDHPAAAATAMGVVAAEIAECDLACSRFRADSELSRLNAGAGRPVEVSDRLLDDLAEALRAAELTGGVVDPTIGRALVLLGYDRDFALLGRPPTDDRGQLARSLPDQPVPDRLVRHRPPADEPRLDRPPLVRPPAQATFAPVPGWRAVQIDRPNRRARIPTGVLVDLGATAKARCADLAAAGAARAAGCGVLVNLGGDIAFAGRIPDGGWRVRVTDKAFDGPGAPGQTVALTSGALATSGMAARTWRHGGAVVHHLIDPRTGDPAPVIWRTVTVAAASCVDANIASTASAILGVTAPAWLETFGLCARLVAGDGTVTTVGGWPTDDALRSSRSSDIQAVGR